LSRLNCFFAMFKVFLHPSIVTTFALFILLNIKVDKPNDVPNSRIDFGLK